jgi:hypothetical protein
MAKGLRTDDYNVDVKNEWTENLDPVILRQNLSSTNIGRLINTTVGFAP